MEKRSFYFSEKQFQIYKNMESPRPTYRLFKGIMYTESRPLGKKPLGKFDDYVHVGDGYYHECEFK